MKHIFWFLIAMFTMAACSTTQKHIVWTKPEGPPLRAEFTQDDYQCREQAKSFWVAPLIVAPIVYANAKNQAGGIRELHEGERLRDSERDGSI